MVFGEKALALADHEARLLKREARVSPLGHTCAFPVEKL